MRSKKKLAATAKLLLSLPEEMQAEILLRLPVKSLLSCKYVCKPWLNLISSPEFINDHLNLSIQNKNNHKIMYTYTRSLITGKPLIYKTDCASITSSPDLSCEYISEKAVLMDTPFEYEEGMKIRILGACNGLVCFGIIKNNTSHICIWNPTTREYKQPFYFQMSIKRFSTARFARVGFGYNSKTGDYKMVRIRKFHGKRDSCEVQVYTFGPHSSRIIHALPYKFPGELTFQGVLLNALHWTSDASNCIISFDISNEKFREVPLPEKSIIYPEDSNTKLYKTLGVLEDCLSLVLVNKTLVQAELWVMQDYGEVGESWSLRFTTSGKPITKYSHWIPIMSLKNGEILMYTYDGFVLCDPKNERIGKLRGVSRLNKLAERRLTMMMTPPLSYVESLVSLNSGTYMKKPTYMKKRKRQTSRSR